MVSISILYVKVVFIVFDAQGDLDPLCYLILGDALMLFEAILRSANNGLGIVLRTPDREWAA